MLEDLHHLYTQDTYSLPHHDPHTQRIMALQRAQHLYELQFIKGMLFRFASRFYPLSLPLLDLTEILAHSPLVASHDCGVYPVPVSAIQGTQGRIYDFDRSFRPVRRHTHQRWINIASLRMVFTPLPAVELIRVEDVYFVRDGHHRISVARALGQEEIDSQVTQYQLELPMLAVLPRIASFRKNIIASRSTA